MTDVNMTVTANTDCAECSSKVAWGECGVFICDQSVEIAVDLIRSVVEFKDCPKCSKAKDASND